MRTVTRSTSGASSARSRRRCAERSTLAIVIARSRVVIASGISTAISLKHWIHGGETNPGNVTLLCTYHHRLLHEGGFTIAKEADGKLRFVTADGCTIPRHGYRHEDFVDDDIRDTGDEPSAEGFCTTAVPRDFERSEVRETAAVYRVKRAEPGLPHLYVSRFR
jgi:hypothetical protein